MMRPQAKPTLFLKVRPMLARRLTYERTVPSFHDLRTSFRIDEKLFALRHIHDLDALAAVDFRKYTCRCQQL